MPQDERKLNPKLRSQADDPEKKELENPDLQKNYGNIKLIFCWKSSHPTQEGWNSQTKILDTYLSYRQSIKPAHETIFLPSVFDKYSEASASF